MLINDRLMVLIVTAARAIRTVLTCALLALHLGSTCLGGALLIRASFAVLIGPVVLVDNLHLLVLGLVKALTGCFSRVVIFFFYMQERKIKLCNVAF